MECYVPDISLRKDPLLDDSTAERDGWLIIDTTIATILDMEYKDSKGTWEKICPEVTKILFYSFSILDMSVWQEGLWRKFPNIQSFAVCPEAESEYFTVDGVLFKDVATGVELVSFPPTRIGKYAIPVGVTGIDWQAFSHAQISDLVFPNSLRYIADGAFFQCHKIERIHIPDSVSRIGEDGWANAFVECKGLSHITVDPNNDAFYSENGVLYRRDGLLLCYPSSLEGPFTVPGNCFGFAHNSFYGSKITELIFPEKEAFYYIGTCALAHCDNLRAINLPQGVGALGFFAFHNCKNLTDVFVNNPDFNFRVTEGYGPFDGCPKIRIHGYPESTAEQYAGDKKLPWEVI